MSVIIPTYNYGRYIGRAIESLLRPGLEGVEVVVIDDGSTDDTPRVVAGYGEAVGYVRQPRQGPYAACKHGLGLTGGEHILFLGADDRVADGALPLIRAALESRPEAGIIFGAVINVMPDGSRRVSPAPRLSGDPVRDFGAFVRGRLEVSAGASVVHRRVLDPFVKRDEPMPHGMDRVIVGRALAGFECHRVEQPLVEVHHHDGRLRDDAASIAAGGGSEGDWLFRSDVVPAEVMHLRGAFEGRLWREHARVFARSGWHRRSVGAFAASVRADPRGFLDSRALRRFLRSSVCAPFEALVGREHSPVPSPPGHFLLGHRPQLVADASGFITGCARRYGDLVRLRTPKATYLLSDPADIKHVLATNALNYHKSGFETVFRDYFGEGLAVTEGDRHRRDRRALAPHFRPPPLALRAPEIASVTLVHAGGWRDGESINLARDLMAWAARLHARFAFGIDDPATTSELFQLVWAAHRGLARQWHRLWPRPAWLPSKGRRRGRRALAAAEAILTARLQDLRRSGTADGSVLSMLEGARASGELPLNDSQMLDIARGMFIPMDPIANTLALALYLLSLHPQAEAAAVAEARGVLGDRPPEPTDLARLPYAGMVVDETLRLYPTVWLLTRRAVTEDRLPRGFTLPAGSRVWISPLAVHRDPRHFADPERFVPERFAPSALATQTPYSYLPFGGGPRICIGNHVTRTTLITALATLLPRYCFEARGPSMPGVEDINGFIMQPQGGVLEMRITRR